MSEIDQLPPETSTAETRQDAGAPLLVEGVFVESGPGERAGWLSSFAAAITFLTRLRLPARCGISSAALHRAPICFPLVGALIGACTAGMIAAGCLIWPVWLAVPAALAVEALLTGALHEDALADFCDAFGGGWTREHVLEILKDSRLGTYGALGLLLGVSLRAAAIMALVLHAGPTQLLTWGAAVVAAPAIGEWIVVLAMICVPPVAGRQSLTSGVGGRLNGRALLISGLFAAPVVALFAAFWPVQSIVAACLLVLLAWRFLAYVRRRLGGLTGDCLGCLAYLSHLLVLLAAAAGSGAWRAMP